MSLWSIQGKWQSLIPSSALPLLIDQSRIEIGVCQLIRRTLAISLLVPQRNQRVDSGGATSWDVGGDGSDGEQ